MYGYKPRILYVRPGSNVELFMYRTLYLFESTRIIRFGK